MTPRHCSIWSFLFFLFWSLARSLFAYKWYYWLSSRLLSLAAQWSQRMRVYVYETPLCYRINVHHFRLMNNGTANTYECMELEIRLKRRNVIAFLSIILVPKIKGKNIVELFDATQYSIWCMCVCLGKRIKRIKSIGANAHVNCDKKGIKLSFTHNALHINKFWTMSSANKCVQSSPNKWRHRNEQLYEDVDENFFTLTVFGYI